MDEWMKNPKIMIPAVGLTLTIGPQMILVFFRSSPNPIQLLQWIGWVLWALSIYFGWMSMREMKKKGKVPKGKSYMRTTKLVTTGPFSVVRHPQYLGMYLFPLSLALISQDWLIELLGALAILFNFLSTRDVDKEMVKKFGRPYEEYMKEVPGFNFILGLYRLFRKKRG